MSKDLAKFNTSGMPVASADDLAAGLAANVQTVESGGIPFIRLGKGGYWAIGQDDEEPDEGSQWVVIPWSFAHGLACWIDGELVGERMVTYDQPPPLANEMPDYGGEWQPQLGVIMQCISGSQEGRQVLYKGTSRGLRSALGHIKNEIVSQIAKDPENFAPIVELDVDDYHHKKYGKIFVPVLEIVGWMNPSDGAVSDEPEDETPLEPEAAKPRKRRTNKASAETDSQPRRRRRRAKA